jgi:hypothetical protein
MNLVVCKDPAFLGWRVYGSPSGSLIKFIPGPRLMRLRSRAVAMRAAWCAKQSPKAWPKEWGVFAVALARGLSSLEMQLTSALFEDSPATFGEARP